MTAAAILPVEDAIAEVFEAAGVGAVAGVEGIYDRKAGAVLVFTSASASPEGEYLAQGRNRWRIPWRITVDVLSKRYHPTPRQARAEVAGIIDKCWQAVADDPQLSTAAAQPLGVEWVEVSDMDVDAPSLAAADDGSGNRWECSGGIELLVKLRNVVE